MELCQHWSAYLQICCYWHAQRVCSSHSDIIFQLIHLWNWKWCSDRYHWFYDSELENSQYYRSSFCLCVSDPNHSIKSSSDARIYSSRTHYIHTDHTKLAGINQRNAWLYDSNANMDWHLSTFSRWALCWFSYIDCYMYYLNHYSFRCLQGQGLQNFQEIEPSSTESKENLVSSSSLSEIYEKNHEKAALDQIVVSLIDKLNIENSIFIDNIKNIHSSRFLCLNIFDIILIYLLNLVFYKASRNSFMPNPASWSIDCLIHSSEPILLRSCSDISWIDFRWELL